MKFLSIYKTAERGVPPSQEEMARMGKLVEEGMKAGYLLAVEGCLPSALGVRVRQTDGKFTVTDGPFVETKELICGLAGRPQSRFQGARHLIGPAIPQRCRRRRRMRSAPAPRGRPEHLVLRPTSPRHGKGLTSPRAVRNRPQVLRAAALSPKPIDNPIPPHLLQ